MGKSKRWQLFVFIHVCFMGVWGALIEIPEKNGFPPTLGYVVWAITMVPVALFALKENKWKIERDSRSILLGMLVGILGSVGQLILFFCLTVVPAYLVFPILSLTPVITILMAAGILKERTGKAGWIGIAIAIIAIFLISYQPQNGAGKYEYKWLLLSIVPLLVWGAQGFFMRWANETSSAESIFFYMMISSFLFVPVALYMTDFSTPVNLGFKGPWLAAIVQGMNSIGALCLVYAFRYGKAIIVAPMTTALSPVLTVLISLFIYAVIPHPIIITGIILAIVSALLMSREETK
ncbi:MAG: protein of unknown function transrane [Chitinophagaceae bacterium]|nr:protein of unknown function transrane [Chitinophagaceae bacterium]